MQKYISILRGINVGGNKTIKMAALSELYATLEFENIKTYIQSGNVIFETKKTSEQTLASKISDAIKNTFKFDVPVIVLGKLELENIIATNPFVKNATLNIDFFHVCFLSNTPDKVLVEKLYGQKDDFYINGKAIYLYCPNGYSNCKLTNGFIEKNLKVVATTRNWKTTLQLLDMATS